MEFASLGKNSDAQEILSPSSSVHLLTAQLDALLMVLHHLEDVGMISSVQDNTSDFHVDHLTLQLEQSLLVLPQPQLELLHKLQHKSVMLLIQLTGLMDLVIIATTEEVHLFNATEAETELLHAQLELHAIVHQELNARIME